MQGNVPNKAGVSRLAPTQEPAISSEPEEASLPHSELFARGGDGVPSASPSRFAGVITCTSANPTWTLQSLMADLSLGSATPTPALIGPSPDDVILQARSKSSLRPKARA
jgi:hypothetical protein